MRDEVRETQKDKDRFLALPNALAAVVSLGGVWDKILGLRQVHRVVVPYRKLLLFEELCQSYYLGITIGADYAARATRAPKA